MCLLHVHVSIPVDGGRCICKTCKTLNLTLYKLLCAEALHVLSIPAPCRLAQVLEGLTFMAPAYAGFRELFKSKIANLEAGGGTNYEAGMLVSICGTEEFMIE